MILPGMLRALRARNTIVYRVTIGERAELFATREAATRFASNLDNLAPCDTAVAVATITPVPASELPDPDSTAQPSIRTATRRVCAECGYPPLHGPCEAEGCPWGSP